jgi:hypothetical protein
MLMAIAGWDRFWIANVIYLCFVLSAVLGSLTKVLVHRGRFRTGRRAHVSLATAPDVIRRLTAARPAGKLVVTV